MSALGLPVPAVEGGRAMSQCDGAATMCIYSLSQPGQDITKGLPESWSNAKSSIQGPEELCVMYGTPKDIGIDRGTHITGLKVQEGADGNDLHQCFHHPYSPSAARLIQRMSGVTSATSETGNPLSTCGHTPGAVVPVTTPSESKGHLKLTPFKFKAHCH